MNAEKPKRACARASTDFNILWDGLNWSEIELVVNKLQSRIAKAVERGRYNLVRKIQYLLTNSFYAKLLAVKRVTTNKGKRTPGIDSELWTSSALKYKAALKLSKKGYIFSDIDHYINQLLRKWAIRRHPNKSFKWRKGRYFVRIKNRDWIFKSETNQLKFAGSFKIKRHILIKLAMNPYFPEHQEYYCNRRLANF